MIDNNVHATLLNRMKSPRPQMNAYEAAVERY